MALRVLLADESSTIKRVIQLSLQDFAVEVKSVNLGVDVVEVAKKFQPDIIFADVLLQKRNGYEVSQDIKADSELSQVPTVLMWSGFIDLDEQKFAESGADDRLEKPFDAETLRDLVRRYVPKTAQQTMSSFLTFPKIEVPSEKPLPTPPPPRSAESMREEVIAIESEVAQEQSAAFPRATPVQAPRGASIRVEETEKPQWTMDSFDDLPDLQEILSPMDAFADLDVDLNDAGNGLPGLPPRPPVPGTPQKPSVDPVRSPEEIASAQVKMPSPNPDEEEEDAWARKDLSQFRLNDAPAEDELTVHFDIEEGPVSQQDFLSTHEPQATQAKPTHPVTAQVRGEAQAHESLSKVTSIRQTEESLARTTVPAGAEEITYTSNPSIRPQELEAPYEPSVHRQAPEPVVLMQAPTPSASIYEGAAVTDFSTNRAANTLSEADIEEIVRKQSQAVIEALARQMIPDIAERLIREELNRLLTEKEARP